MHAYFPSLNSFPSLLADMLGDAINCLGFTWVRIPPSPNTNTEEIKSDESNDKKKKKTIIMIILVVVFFLTISFPSSFYILIYFPSIIILITEKIIKWHKQY